MYSSQSIRLQIFFRVGDNKQQVSSKELSENSTEKGSTNSILVTENVNVPKQDHKLQNHDDKKESRSKKSAKTKKEKVVISQQIRQSRNN